MVVRYLGRSSHHKLVDLGLSILCGCKCSDGVHCTHHGLERRKPDRSNPVSTSQFHIPATRIATNLNHIHTSSVSTNNTIKIFSLRTCRIISFFGKFLRWVFLKLMDYSFPTPGQSAPATNFDTSLSYPSNRKLINNGSVQGGMGTRTGGMGWGLEDCDSQNGIVGTNSRIIGMGNLKWQWSEYWCLMHWNKRG